MDFFGIGMMPALGCGCCCLAVVLVVGIAGLLGTRRKREAPAALGEVGAAPLRGSSTTARLTLMEEAQEAQLRRERADRALPRGRQAPAPKSAPPPGPPSPDTPSPRVEPLAGLRTSTPPVAEIEPIDLPSATSQGGPRVLTSAKTSVPDVGDAE
ncbi:MAG: hypothetical protein EXR71_02490 [Myxococcales bacterium]|nr:hypothetical protein [Myxococcales bacterium]